jgi:hypothetical protein
VAVATLLVLPGDEMTVAAVRAPGASFCGEVAASAWKGMMAVRFCAADGAALRHEDFALTGLALASIVDTVRLGKQCTSGNA